MSVDNTKTDAWLTPKEAADYLGYSKNYIYDLLRGNLKESVKTKRMGGSSGRGRILISKKSLDRLYR